MGGTISLVKNKEIDSGNTRVVPTKNPLTLKLDNFSKETQLCILFEIVCVPFVDSSLL